MQLDPIQLRVLGSLIEKEIATPENYPLSLNSLANACNQKSSRDPVLELTEDQIRQALHSLEDMALVSAVHDGRVPKYEHRIRTVLNLRRDETAVLCLLMLRGPQTPGEIRSRADRLYTFDDLASAQATLERLAARNSPPDPASPDSIAPDTVSPPNPSATGPLTLLLPRQPGSREARYAHLLGGTPETVPAPSLASPSETPGATSQAQRISQMEAGIASLTAALSDLQARVEQLESNSPAVLK
jgi:uncharacterized protein